MHEAERAELSARAEKLEERIREMELVSARQVEEAKAVAEQRCVRQCASRVCRLQVCLVLL